ncbi:BRCA1-A complex subunit RAP80 isoform X2 [Pelobates cultripes]|uniref:BRCA1-A complex subunit RAP80 isoform X2 n=1 Tax=Pelobates cultripes TaxID=61616 RepID=A0AAD1RUA5_PELCU|nr:BRCA1-A complex subunit RAP80 isoform X2 [Pelobates cultripes]
MCGQQFSLSQIEMHAAYCDGEKQETVLRSRRKLTQRNLAGPSNLLPNPDFGKFEKCYLCKTVVQLEDYQTHVDNCLKMATLETPRSRRLRSTKQESKGQNGRLLSMLDKSEAITSGAHSSLPEVDCMRISPPREENNESMNNEDLTVSDSPIRSFVSISEATDCLVDFKKQFSRQPGGGGPRRHAKGQPSGGGPRRHAKGRWRKR